MSKVVGLPNNSYKHITNTAWVRTRLCKLQKGCTRLAASSDKVYQLLAHGRWFSSGTPVSSTTKTGRHDIAEILLKMTLTPPPPPKKNHEFVIETSIFVTNASNFLYFFYISAIFFYIICLNCFYKATVRTTEMHLMTHM